MQSFLFSSFLFSFKDFGNLIPQLCTKYLSFKTVCCIPQGTSDPRIRSTRSFPKKSKVDGQTQVKLVGSVPKASCAAHGTHLGFLLLPPCHRRHEVSPNCELSQALPSFLSCSWSGIWSQKQAKSLTKDKRDLQP